MLDVPVREPWFQRFGGRLSTVAGTVDIRARVTHLLRPRIPDVDVLELDVLCRLWIRTDDSDGTAHLATDSCTRDVFETDVGEKGSCATTTLIWMQPVRIDVETIYIVVTSYVVYIDIPDVATAFLEQFDKEVVVT